MVQSQCFINQQFPAGGRFHQTTHRTLPAQMDNKVSNELFIKVEHLAPEETDIRFVGAGTDEARSKMRVNADLHSLHSTTG